MIKISVIIPAYNAEKTIQETIESVLKQTLSDFEIIIIDDGSQDGTVEIVSTFSDSRIKAFSYANAGACVSRNRGFTHSIGEFIAFLDADDLWKPNKLKSQLQALENNPRADVAYSWSDCINEQSKFLRRGGYSRASGNVYPQLLLLNILENGSNPLIRRQAIADIGGFDESLPAGQDWDLYLRLAINRQFILVPRKHILYRASTDSISSNLDNLEAGSLQVINQAFKQAPESLQKLKRSSLANLYKYLVFKVLNEKPDINNGIKALRFISQLIKHDPSLLKEKVLIKLLLKTSVFIIIPSYFAQKTISKHQQLFNTTTLMGYLIS